MKPNILVISDLHLGFKYFSEEVENNLVSFIEYYTKHKHNKRHWKLIINGDMFEFLGSIPRKYFDKYVWDEGYIELIQDTLDVIFEKHEKFLAVLANFVVEGNELLIIRGNHDPELNVARISRRVKELLFSLTENRTIDSRGKFFNNIKFEPYAYYEPGNIHIEHGHMYDMFNAWQIKDENYTLHDLPFGTYFTRGLRSYFHSMALFQMENCNVFRIFKWMYVKKLSWKFLLLLPLIYASILISCFRGYFNKKNNQELPNRFKDLVKLWALPNYTSILGIAGAVYLDKVFFGCLALLLAAIIGGWEGFIIGGSFVLIGEVIGRSMLTRYQIPKINKHIRDVSTKVADTLCVPLVVFGHTHRADLGDRYINLGAWYVDTVDHFVFLKGIWKRNRLKTCAMTWCDRCGQGYFAAMRDRKCKRRERDDTRK